MNGPLKLSVINSPVAAIVSLSRGILAILLVVLGVTPASPNAIDDMLAGMSVVGGSSAARGGNWVYRNGTDELSGKEIRQASVRSNNQFEFKFPYRGAQRAQLTISNHPRWGLAVAIGIERGQFACGFGDCTISVQFNHGAIYQYDVSPPESLETTLRFVRNYKDFLARMSRSETVSVEAAFFNEGTRSFHFNTKGFDW